MSVTDDTVQQGVRLKSNSLKQNPAVFRYWQRIVHAVRNIVRYRTPIGAYLATGFYEESFQRGFDLHDEEDKEQKLTELNERLTPKFIDDYTQKLIQAYGTARYHGYCLMVYFKFQTNEEKQFYWIKPKDITKIIIEPGTKNVTELHFNPPIFTDDSKQLKPIELKPKDPRLEDVLLIGNYSETIGQYRAWVDPIFDDLIGLANTNQQTALRTIRVSSGLRYIMAPASIIGDDEAQAKLEKFLNNFGMNSYLVFPEGAFGADGKQRFEFGIKFGEGSLPSNPKDDRDIHLEAISGYTRLPRETFIGSELGLRSAETNRQGFLNQVNLAQIKSNYHYMWGIDRVVQDTKDETESIIDLYTPKWRPFVEVDETEKVELDMKRIDIMVDIMPVMDRLGWDQQVVQDLIGLEMVIDEALKQKAENEAKELKDAMMGGNQDQDDADTSANPNDQDPPSDE